MTTPREMARHTDPHTSHTAAEDHVTSGKLAHQQEIVLDLVRQHCGWTSAELSDWSRCGFNTRLAPWVDRYVVARRLPELERRGLVHRGEARVCMVTGRSALTWWPS